MRHTHTRYFSMIPVLAAYFCMACTPMTEAQRDARDYARAEWNEQFRTARADCRNRRGLFVVDGTAGLDRDDIPRTRVFYSCA